MDCPVLPSLRSLVQRAAFACNNKRALRIALCVTTVFAAGCNPVSTSTSKIDRYLEPVADIDRSTDASALEQEIARVLERNLHLRKLSSEENAAWQVIHGAVAYGTDLLLEVDGEKTRALDYLFSGGELAGWNLRLGDWDEETGRNGIRVPVEEGSYTGQGHVDQFIGYISQTAVPLDTPILIGEHELTLGDWVRQAQRDICNNPYREYSWTLIALTNYFPNELQWTGTDGKTWALESFVQFEADQDLSTSACGGMHRLMGLAHSVRFWENQGRHFDRGWLRAKQVVDGAIRSAKAYQNTDGSFSTRYTIRPGNSSDMSTCIGATGHTLEFLAYALPKSELSEEWMERAVWRLCQMLESTESVDLECGAGYHALAGLRLYASRRYGNR